MPLPDACMIHLTIRSDQLYFFFFCIIVRLASTCHGLMSSTIESTVSCHAPMAPADDDDNEIEKRSLRVMCWM